jgi:hypothetical protein
MVAATKKRLNFKKISLNYQRCSSIADFFNNHHHAHPSRQYMTEIDRINPDNRNLAYYDDEFLIGSADEAY